MYVLKRASLSFQIGIRIFAAAFFTIFTFKTNSIAPGLQYFIGLRIILCYVNFQIYQKPLVGH
ncbi:hypothetical protein D1AOALGA4SA_8476 [Olavius algarvensis Delta 1 endosymbiont]|nr:hypothetical protein D1AOALGA4SA_8476 [Olavius algarvensis Delta 1 endosymbiont]